MMFASHSSLNSAATALAFTSNTICYVARSSKHIEICYCKQNHGC